MLHRLFWMIVALTFTPTLLHAQSEPYPACPADNAGYLPARLTLGQVAEIQAGGTPNRVRRLPSLDGEYLFDIAPGSQFPLIGGAVCADGIVWWQVAAGGRVGWTAESNTADRLYYLQSAPPEAQPTTTLDSILSASGSAAITPENVASLAPAPIPALPARAMAVSGFNNLLAVLNPTGDSLLLYNAAAPTLPFAGESLDGEGVALAASATSVSLAVGLRDADAETYRARLYAYLPGDLAPVVPTLDEDIDLSEGGEIVSMALQPPYLAMSQSLDEDGGFGLWDSNTGEALATFELSIGAGDLRFNAEGTLLLASNAYGGVYVTHIVDTAEQDIVEGLGGHGRVAFIDETRFVLGAHTTGEITFNRAFPISEGGILDGEADFIRVEPTGMSRDDIRITSLAVNPQASLLAFTWNLQPEVTEPTGIVPSLGFVDLATRSLIPLDFPLTDVAEVRELAFSADGSALLALVETDDGISEVRTYAIAETDVDG